MSKNFKILYSVTRAFGKIFSYNHGRKLKFVRDVLYSYRLSVLFKSFPSTARIQAPINLKGAEYISFGEHSGIGARAILSAWDSYLDKKYSPSIRIGDYVWIGEDSHITAIDNIEIGNHVLMGKKVTISDNSHGEIDIDNLIKPPLKRELYSKGAVIIGDNVWIGDKVTILPGVKIGSNSIVGANSVVTGDVPSNCVVGGIPAKIIREIN